MTTDPKPAWDAPLTARQAAVKRAVDGDPVGAQRSAVEIKPDSDQAFEIRQWSAGFPEFVRNRRAAEKRAGETRAA